MELLHGLGDIRLGVVEFFLPGPCRPAIAQLDDDFQAGQAACDLVGGFEGVNHDAGLRRVSCHYKTLVGVSRCSRYRSW